jgi:hypothetical protein
MKEVGVYPLYSLKQREKYEGDENPTMYIISVTYSIDFYLRCDMNLFLSF